jgi:hypothetical protein
MRWPKLAQRRFKNCSGIFEMYDSSVIILGRSRERLSPLRLPLTGHLRNSLVGNAGHGETFRVHAYWTITFDTPPLESDGGFAVQGTSEE